MWVASAIRDKLFGTSGRTFTTISISFSIISIGLTVFYVNYSDKVPEYVAFRDLILWLALIILSVFLAGRYFYREAIIQRKTNFLSEQLKLSQDLVHNYRNELFKSYYQPNVQRHKLTEKDLM